MSRKFLTPIVLPADPAAPLEAATKQYVDSKVTGGGGGTEEVFVGPSDPLPSAPTLELWYDTDASAPGLGLPAGGTVAGQVLTKASATNYDAVWSEPAIRFFTTLANRNAQWVNPAKGSIAIVTGEAAPYTNVANMVTMWDGAAWQWVRAWGTPWGVVKYTSPGNGPNVQVPTSGITLLHTPMAFTFIAGRQYKYCWNVRAQASNNGVPTAANMGLYDGSTPTGWIDQWAIYAGQWENQSGSIPFTDNQTRSLALGFNGTPNALTIYFTHAWIEDLGPVAP